jgi:predicted amidohydrolase
MAELLIQGGELVDPGQGLRGRLDIAISQGKITQIAPHIDPREADRVVASTRPTGATISSLILPVGNWARGSCPTPLALTSD